MPRTPSSKAGTLRAQLAEGRHALALGRVPELTAHFLAHPDQAARRAAHLIEFLWDDDPGVASRAADILERITRRSSPIRDRIFACSTDSKDALLGLLPEASPKKLRWNLALMLGRLPLTAMEARRAAAVLQSWLNDSSSIVKTAALQGLADLTRMDPSLLHMVQDLLRMHSRSGTAAMRTRSRILLQSFEKRRGDEWPKPWLA